MLLGIWKNVEDLEESICLEELEAILSASRDREHRQNKFMAALKGIDIDKEIGGSAKDKVEEMKQRLAAKQAGKSEDHFEIEQFGLDVEVEE